MKISNIIKFLVSLLLASVLFYFVFKDVSLDDFISRLENVSFGWVLLSMGLSIVSHVLRSYRWNLTLAPLGHYLSTARTFLALMVGYLANLAFPRLGEVTRCAMLKKSDNVSMTVGFGSVITERLLDFVILLSLISLDFIVEFDKIFYFFLGEIGWDSYQNKTLFIVVGITVMLMTGLFGIWLVRWFLHHEFDNEFVNKVKTKISTLLEGLFSIRKMENVIGYVFSTVGIWVLYFLMSYVIFFSMDETSHLGFGAGLSILAAAGVSMAMPVQGGVGAYHALVSGVLIVYGVEPTTALFFATLLHTSQIIMIMVLGSGSLVASMFIPKGKTAHEVIT
ncbi:MAG: flippase-like domain-containing protein [Reichenbachiella sp.]